MKSPMPAPMIGSANVQPVSNTTAAARITPTEPSMSASTSKYAPLRFRLSREPACSIFIDTRLTARPTTATASIGPPRISGGARNRCQAS